MSSTPTAPTQLACVKCVEKSKRLAEMTIALTKRNTEIRDLQQKLRLVKGDGGKGGGVVPPVVTRGVEMGSRRLLRLCPTPEVRKNSRNATVAPLWYDVQLV